MSKVENSEILKEQVGISSTISAAEEESKENKKKESIKLEAHEAGEGFLDLTNGNYGFTHLDTESMGEVLDLKVAHIFDSRNKTSEQEEVKLKNGAIVKLNKGGLGEGFRTNYNQFLVKDTTGIVDGDEVSERFIYVDGKGDKHIFEEKYFYKDSEGKKNYVQKSEITIDMDKNLWHEEDGTKYEVEKEVTDGNLKLVAKLEGITGLENIDTDIEEIAQVKSQIKEIQEYIASCNKQLEFNKKKELLLAKTKTLNDDQKALQDQSLESELVDLNDQKVLHEDYQEWVDYYGDAYTIQVDMRTYANEGQDGQPNAVEHGLKTNLNAAQEKLRTENYRAMWTQALDGENDCREKRMIALNNANKTFAKNSAELNTKQTKFQKEQLDYENSQLNDKIVEYELLLEKKKQELKELERQVPVHYLIDENGNFMGFGKINPGSVEESNIFRLIVIGDNYENTILISYDEKKEEENRIEAISHSNSKQVEFKYENNKLVKITDAFGNETKFTYNGNKLIEIANGEEKTKFVYAEDDLTAIIDNNGDGLSMTKVGTKVTIKDITKHLSIDNVGGILVSENTKNKLNIDSENFVGYNCYVVDFASALNTSLTDEIGNVTAYTFNVKGETLAKVITNSNDKELQKEFNYIGENCSFTASPNLFATEYVTQENIALENGIAIKELLPETITAIDNSKATEFVFSAFAKCDSAVIERTCSMHEKAGASDTPKFELRAEISYEGEEESKIDIQYCSFDYNNKDLQYLAFPVSLDKNKTLVGIKLIFDYSFNTGEASVKEMSFREGTWVHKTLNEDKLVTEVKTSNGEVETLSYDDKKRLVKATLVKDNETKKATFEYNKYGELTRATDYNGIVIEKEFNENGELIKTCKYNKNEPATRQVEETILDEKGREVKSVNELGEEVEGNGVSCTNSNGTAMEISSSVNGEDNSNVLSYTLGMLTKVSHNGFDWGYTYDHKKRLTKVDLCGEIYLTKAYDEVENLDKITTTLANNEKFIESLDINGNVTKVEYVNNGVTETLVENEYNDFGKLTKTTENGVETNITYDKFGNVIQTSGTQNKKAFVVSGEYDKDKVTQKSIKIGDELKTSKFAYDSQDRLNKVELPNGKEQSLTYDGLGRVKTESVGDISKNISYVKKDERTCNLVASVDYALDNKTTNNTKYAYDKNGNITEIRENGKLVNRYEYDSIGRLVREDNRALNKTITYEYDKGGNIRRRFEHLFTLAPNAKLEEITCILKKEENKNVSWDSPKITDLEYDYSYKTNGNNDQILEYCGKKFEYDKIGNPVVYMDKALKFTKGRELIGFDYNANNGTSRLEFKYNANGLRIQKLERNAQTDNTFVTDYYLDGKNVVREERSRKYDNGTLEGGKSLVRTINYTYGVNGVIGFSIKNENDTIAKEYLYIKNIQGDIIGIVDIQGNEIAKYDYSAFGKQKVSYKQNGVWVEITSEAYNDDKNYAVAVANPFRYRGYYFDTETNLYYLRSRYYDSELCRFVTIDDISYIDTETINGINLYAYCGNNPVMRIDSNGSVWYNPATWDWGAILVGVGLIYTATLAITLSVLTFGAATPLAMGIVAGITLAAGVLVGINGIAAITEGIAGGYNFMRDGLFNSVLGLSDNAYNWYVGITDGVATIGTIILGTYQSTGKFKAIKKGRKYIGKGSKKVIGEDGKIRWISKDGMRQMRFDHPHMYKGEMIGMHINIDFFKTNFWLNSKAKINTKKAIHLIYELFELIIK